MLYCSQILKGLPTWATKMEDAANDDNKDTDDSKEAEEEAEENDDYGKICNEYNWDVPISVN